jgi:hypothetical protein
MLSSSVRYSMGFRRGGLHDIPSQDVSQTSTANMLLACGLAFDAAGCITFLAIFIASPLLYSCAVL